MRIAIAIEVEVPDGFDMSTIEVTSHGLGVQVQSVKEGRAAGLLAGPIRYEVHSDPDAIFAEIEMNQD